MRVPTLKEAVEEAKLVIVGKPSKSFVLTALKLSAFVLSLDGAIVLPGWTCECGSFNGAEKTLRIECRSCGKARCCDGAGSQ